MKEFREAKRELTDALTDQTIVGVRVKPFCTGLDGAFDGIDIRLSNGTLIEFKAGSYCIPEESCIYTEINP